MPRRTPILHFDDINRAHAAMGFAGRTDLPDFHIFTVEETYPSTRRVMPPYTLRFHCITLLEHSDDATLEVNAERLVGPSDTVAFQSPGHVVAWVRGAAQRGFILYFQPEFLGHHPAPLADDFPFFRVTEANALVLASGARDGLRDHFARLRHTFAREHPYRVQLLQAQLLGLLYECKALHDARCARAAADSTRAALAVRFQRAVDQHYLTRQSVRDYAELLAVSPNHLSRAVAAALGRGAHELIADRLALEARKLLRYSDLSVAEIADYLGFAEPTHFGRFFKREIALTPNAYRRAVRSAATSSTIG